MYLLHFLAVLSQKVEIGGAVSTDAELHNLWASDSRNVSMKMVTHPQLSASGERNQGTPGEKKGVGR